MFITSREQQLQAAQLGQTLQRQHLANKWLVIGLGIQPQAGQLREPSGAANQPDRKLESADGQAVQLVYAEHGICAAAQLPVKVQAQVCEGREPSQRQGRSSHAVV